MERKRFSYGLSWGFTEIFHRQKNVIVILDSIIYLKGQSQYTVADGMFCAKI